MIRFSKFIAEGADATLADKAKKSGFFQEDIISMPANNFSIIYKKVSS